MQVHEDVQLELDGEMFSPIDSLEQLSEPYCNYVGKPKVVRCETGGLRLIVT